MIPQGKKKQLLVCHAVRGRLRVRFASLRLSETDSVALAQWLLGHPEVEEAQVRYITGSIIIRYNPQGTNQTVILSILSKITDHCAEWLEQSDSMAPTESVTKATHHKTNGQFRFGWRLLWLIGLTAFSIYELFRRFILKSPLPEGMLSLTGIVAAIGTVPILKEGASELAKKQGLGLYLFLGGACILAILAGQATAALEVAWVTSLSIFIEGYVTDKSRRAIRESLKWQVKNTYIIIDGIEREIPLTQVKKGDNVSIHAGDRIPVDGIVIHGEGLVDEAHLTGRAEPEVRGTGDFVYAGTVLKFGNIIVHAKSVGDDTYISRMLLRVEDALSNRAPVERKADILAKRLTFLGSAATLGTLLFTGNLVRALTVMLIAACPCATALAASTAITAAIANAAKKRVFIKGGLYLERIGSVDCFAFDKTGTVTIETSMVDEVIDLGPQQDGKRILTLAFAAEMHNPHPIARAIVNEAQKLDIPFPGSTTSEIALGRGVSVRAGDDVIVVGNAQLMEDQDIDVSSAMAQGKHFHDRGSTLVYVAKNGNLEGLIVLSNEVRPGAKNLMKSLKHDGVQEVHLVTGDLDPVAKALSQELGLDGYGSSLLPESKAHYIKDIKKRGREVAMVGDGVNDALALSSASVGIAMGAGGSEVALEAADIALVDSDLAKIMMLRQLSRDTMGIIEQNHWIAVSTNIIGMFLGALGKVGPFIAGLIHIVHTLGIMVNSGRLLTWQEKTRNREKTCPETNHIPRQAVGGIQ
jgi:cation-transporting P-type ATPase C